MMYQSKTLRKLLPVIAMVAMLVMGSAQAQVLFSEDFTRTAGDADLTALGSTDVLNPGLVSTDAYDYAVRKAPTSTQQIDFLNGEFVSSTPAAGWTNIHTVTSPFSTNLDAGPITVTFDYKITNKDNVGNLVFWLQNGDGSAPDATAASRVDVRHTSGGEFFRIREVHDGSANVNHDIDGFSSANLALDTWYTYTLTYTQGAAPTLTIVPTAGGAAVLDSAGPNALNLSKEITHVGYAFSNDAIGSFDNFEISQEREPEPITSSTGGFVQEGDTLTLTAPTGSSYQWKRNSVDLSGETNAQLIFNPVLDSHGGIYVVEYDDGSKAIVESLPFTLTVYPVGSLPISSLALLTIVVLTILVAGKRVQRVRND